MKYIKSILYILLIVVFLLSSCTPANEEPLCNINYFEYKTGECCLDNNNNSICDSDEKSSFNMNNIQISMEGKEEQDLYLNGDGGPYSSSVFIEIANNNEQEMCFRVLCDSFNFHTAQGTCSPSIYDYEPWSDEYYVYCIEGNSKTSEEVRMSAHISPETWEGSYGANIEVELIKYYDEINQEYVYPRSKLKAFPIMINVHNLNE